MFSCASDVVDFGEVDDDERGSGTVEAVGLLIPVTVACLLLLIFALRLAVAGQDLTATAAAAARAASRQPTAAAGLTAAQAETVHLSGDAAVASALSASAAGEGRCAQVGTVLDADTFIPGGTAVVTVTCTLSTRELTGLTLPGHLTRTVTSRAPIDLYVTADGR